MMMKLNKRYAIYGGVTLVAVAIVFICIYGAAQSLLHHVMLLQLKRAGYADPQISGVRIYWDGVVVKSIKPDAYLHLQDVYTDQSPPHIAQYGIQQLIIRHADFTPPPLAQWRMDFPFPQIKRLSIENLNIVLGYLQPAITVQGTLKSLQPTENQVVLRMSFHHSDAAVMLQGAMDIVLVKGKMKTVDVNLEDGTYQSDKIGIKRLNGWMHLEHDPETPLKAEAQFTAGSALYEGIHFSDSMAQYSFSSDQAAQWTITLNRPSDQYFNTWVIKETQRPGRYAMQIAAQAGDQTKTRTMVVTAPVQLALLLAPPPQAELDAQPD